MHQKLDGLKMPKLWAVGLWAESKKGLNRFWGSGTVEITQV